MEIPAVTANSLDTVRADPGLLASLSRDASKVFQVLLDEAMGTTESAGAKNAPYVVRSGDTLWAICQRQLALKGYRPLAAEVQAAVNQVCEANDLQDPDRIHPGQQLDLTAVSARASIATKNSSIVGRIGSGHTALAGGPATQVDLAAFLESVLDAPRRVAETKQGVVATDETPWSGVVDSSARITSAFGLRPDPFTGRLTHHAGIDLAADPGTQVKALMPGVVAFSGWDPAYGRMVIVRHNDGVETVYAHNARNLVRKGQRVDESDVVGTVGTTGRSTGPHVHFEVRKHGNAVDPIPYLDEKPVQVAKLAKGYLR